MLKTISLASIVLLVSLGSVASAAPVSFLDFTGWDHSAITKGGQTFEDICGDVDVTVIGVGAFSADSSFVNTSAGSAIRTEQAVPGGSHSFVFTFSEPVELDLAFTRLDGNEKFTFTASGPELYTHAEGLPPTEMVTGGGLMLNGNGFGIDAASGQVSIGPTSVLTVTYDALPTASITKYADFNLAKAVPEPASLSMIGLALLGMIGRLRNRR